MAEEKDKIENEVTRREKEILAFWRKNDIFNKSLEKDSPKGEYVFYDGPPFATGLPHYGHILAGTIKDAVPRYQTMRGYRVRRKWGWDCHGLPLENIIEQKLGLKTKKDIEELGVETFNEAARDAVLEYADDWRRIVPRLGRWVDMEHDYKTMDASYTESVWWVFKELHKKGLVYKGFKSMHLCPRCGTTLSNFEVNQGYKDIKDIAVTVKLELLDENKKKTGTSLLVWTTTPWTLPGNMAAAVHEDFDYVKVEVTTDDGKEIVILAKEKLDSLENEYNILEIFKGKKLVGRSYVPPFDYFKNSNGKASLDHQDLQGDFENAWKIYHAPYVSLEEGTGAVHLAPAYGNDDMALAKECGIPIVHHVGEDGRFLPLVTDLAEQLVKPKDDEENNVHHLDADIEIVKSLKARGKLFKKENITHSYPLCWRCDTPLLNYATTSWFVEVTKIKDKLVKENKKIHWVPEHVGSARFGNWLEGAVDWAISRQRYWGAPLPAWKNPKTDEYKIFGSLEELQKYVPKSGNKYFIMRHGEGDHNVSHIMSSNIDTPHHLTEKGKKQVLDAVRELRNKKIDYIYTSPLIRTKETADIISKELGLSKEQVIIEERIHENLGGIFEGRPVEEWYKYRNELDLHGKLHNTYEGGESWVDIRKRMVSVLFDLEKKYSGKNILFISHGLPLRLMKWGAELASDKEIVRQWDDGDLPTGSVHEVDFTLFPHNRNYELDYHRPYIDEIELYDGETKLERVPDVFDCWFESGSMPYGQQHYPFENTDIFEPKKGRGYPANFIAEGLDQTRGWFYSLIVLGTALFGRSPYKNVIVNGIIFGEDGQKMSKRLQNYPDPMEVVNNYGADALRFYLLSSSIIRGEDLNFSEKNLAELGRKNIGRLANVLAFYELYKSDTISSKEAEKSEHILDKWILARTNELIDAVTKGMENYELDRATRPITDFIDDLSVWYLRRSRDRFKGNNEEDKKAALATLQYVLRKLSLVIAPSMPFFAEYLFLRVKNDDDPESVHLAKWPEASSLDKKELKLLGDMKLTRNFVSLALEKRSTHKIKVRQPLQTLSINDGGEITDEYKKLIIDEVNIKEVISLEGAEEEVQLDIDLTDELKKEGEARELIRLIQNLRKDERLTPQDSIRVELQTDSEGEEMVKQFMDMIRKTINAEDITFAKNDGTSLTLEGRQYVVKIAKIS